MTCKPTKLNLSFLKNTTFHDLKADFNLTIEKGEFEVTTLNGATVASPSVVLADNSAFVKLSELANLGEARYTGNFYYTLNGHRHIAFTSDILITSDPSRLTCSSEGVAFNIVEQEMVVEVDISQAVVNIGGGGLDPAALQPYLKKTEAEDTYQHKGDYAMKSDIPSVPSLSGYQKTVDADAKYQAKGDFATNAALNTVKNTVDANAASIAANSQQVSLNTQNVQAMQTALGYKADKAYVDNNFVTTATADGRFALKSHTHSYNDLTDRPNLFSGNYNDLSNKPNIPSLAGYATENWASNTFQPKGNYLIPSDLTPYQKTIDADNKYQPKGSYLTTVSWADVTGKPTAFAPSAHGHNASEISGLVDYSKQYQITGNLGLSDILNNTLLIGKTTATIAVPTGLASGFVCEVYASVGDITVSGASGVSFEANGGKFIIKQGKSAVLIQIGNSNNFILKGDLA